MTASRSLFGSIRSRLIFGSMLLSLVPLVLISAVLGLIAIRLSSDAVESRVQDQLRAVHAVKSVEIRDRFGALAAAVRSLNTSEEIRAAVPRLSAFAAELPARLQVSADAQRRALDAYYDGDFEREYAARNNGAKAGLSRQMADLPATALAMQYLYIARNPNPLGSKHLLVSAADDPTEYSALHASLQQQLRRWIREYGFYDIFLVNPEGDIVYTYFKELDFGTNLRTGPWADTPIGEAFRQAALGSDPQGVYISEFAPYRPSYDDQAAFLGTPLFSGGRRIGVLIAQMPIDRISQVVNFGGAWNEAGLGGTGETVLLGADGTHRADSRRRASNVDRYAQALAAVGVPAATIETMRVHGSTIGLIKDESAPALAALRGEKTAGVFTDYLGRSVLAVSGPVDVLNQRFGFIVKVDEAEAYGPITALRNGIGGTAVGGLLLLGLVAAFVALRLAQSINRPLGHFGEVVDKVAKGDNVARVQLPPTDEIGQLGVAFDHMLDERIATQRRIEQENDQLNNSVVEIMTSVAELAQRNLSVKVPVSEDVTGAVSDAINMMTRSTATALGKVRSISNVVSSASENVRQRSDQVQGVATAASDQATAASAELQQTAMALREMGEQAREANQFAERAIKTTGDAMEIVRATVSGISESRDQIRETEKRVKRLGERSQEITSVVNIIGQIAERTSVLALNASMQAVAAGDAGRGFAVVADEVKRLAENARQATQQISSLVNAIQADTSETIQAMNRTIAQVVDISRLADQAGGQMNDNRAATEQLALAVRNIATTTQAQSRASQTLLTRAYELLQSSQQTLEQIEAQRQDTETLAGSAQDLVATVSEFRLPA